MLTANELNKIAQAASAKKYADAQTAAQLLYKKDIEQRILAAAQDGDFTLVYFIPSGTNYHTIQVLVDLLLDHDFSAQYTCDGPYSTIVIAW